MRNVYLLLLSVCAIQIAIAQTPATPMENNLNVERVQDLKTVDQADVDIMRAKAGDRAPTSYRVNFSEAIDYVLTGDDVYDGFAFATLWPDSTVKVVDPVGGDYFWLLHGYASTFDPISVYIAEYLNANETIIGDAVDLFNDDHGFQIDSVRFHYFYDRLNSDYVDTLRVYVMSPNSTVFAEGFYFDQDLSGTFEEGVDISLILNKYNSSQNRPNGSYTEYMFLLDDDDTASFNSDSRTIPLDIFIPDGSADHTVGIAFEYNPGQPYSFGDTLYDLSDPPLEVANDLNAFTLLCYEEQVGLFPVSWTEATNNQAGIATWEVRYDLSPGNWNGYYISTFAYDDAFSLEHAYVDWYVAPVGSYFVSSEPSPCEDLTINFTDLSNFIDNPDDATYFWDFGDGLTSFEQDPTHVYDSPGTKNVCLIATEGSESYQFCKNVVVDVCDAINNIDNLTSFTVYPVPATDVLNMDVRFSTPENISISISNIQGQVVYTETLNSVSNYTGTVDVSALADGIYTVQISTNTQIATKSFVIAK
ncbi:MAG: T9SS type A sorting domain-containing protein [Fimbriimonadaceae bacterium]|nr:T9SS type A sorting domain-containing protein [Chitinophagales bacterium]